MNIKSILKDFVFQIGMEANWYDTSNDNIKKRNTLILTISYAVFYGVSQAFYLQSPNITLPMCEKLTFWFMLMTIFIGINFLMTFLLLLLYCGCKSEDVYSGIFV